MKARDCIKTPLMTAFRALAAVAEQQPAAGQLAALGNSTNGEAALRRVPAYPEAFDLA